MNFYKHHIGDYDADTSHLSWIEDMAYTRLIRLYYRRELAIPADISQACRLVRASTKQEKIAVESMLNEFFVLESDGWHNKRCDEEIEALSNKASANRENGKKGGRPKRNSTEQEPIENPDGFKSETQNNLLQTPDSKTPESKSGYAASGTDPRKQLFELGRTILGANSGGLISKAIRQTDESTVGAILGEMAIKAKADPRAYFAEATKTKERGLVA